LKFENLHSHRINLIEAGDWGLEDMHEYSKNPLFYEYMEDKPHESIEETKDYIESWLTRSKEGNGFLWFIYHKKDKKVIGSVGLWNIDWKRRSICIGYGLSPDY